MATTNLQALPQIPPVPLRQPIIQMYSSDITTDLNALASNNAVPWTSTLRMNVGFFWSSANPTRVYVRRAGIYWSSFSIYLTCASVVGTLRYVPNAGVRINGTSTPNPLCSTYIRNASASTAEGALGQSQLLTLAAGEYVEVVINRTASPYVSAVNMIPLGYSGWSLMYINRDDGAGKGS